MVSKADANNSSTDGVNSNNSYFTDKKLNNLSCIKLICGVDEYTIDKQEDILSISEMFSSLKITEYSADEVYGFTIIKFVKSNREELTVSLTSDLIYIDGRALEINTDILASIKEIADTYELKVI